MHGSGLSPRFLDLQDPEEVPFCVHLDGATCFSDWERYQVFETEGNKQSDKHEEYRKQRRQENQDRT